MATHQKRRIVFVTGTRAEFGKLKPLMAKLVDSHEFHVDIFVTGMHMLRQYGHTFREIRKSGFSNVYHHISHTGHAPLESILASTVVGIGNYIREFKPEMVVVHGDRVEALAGALAGAFNNTLVAHIEGGEVSGTLDEHMRHSISKMANLHFVANREAQRRLLQLGERPESIFRIGSPDIDVMRSQQLPSALSVKRRYHIPFKDYAILAYHPVTSEVDSLDKQVGLLLDAVIASPMNYLVIHPNNDPGTDIIRDVYTSRLKGNKRFKVYPSIRFELFLSLLKSAHFVIGNSSLGIREAPFFGVPTVDVGTRQYNRIRTGTVPSVVHCDYDPGRMADAIGRFSRSKTRFRPKSGFGAGNSGKKFLDILRSEKPWSLATQKHFHDVEFV